MIEKVADRVFKTRIKVEEHPQAKGWLPDERRFLWSIILGLIILQLITIHYLSIFPEQVNQKINEINMITSAYGASAYGDTSWLTSGNNSIPSFEGV